MQCSHASLQLSADPPTPVNSETLLLPSASLPADMCYGLHALAPANPGTNTFYRNNYVDFFRSLRSQQQDNLIISHTHNLSDLLPPSQPSHTGSHSDPRPHIFSCSLIPVDPASNKVDYQKKSMAIISFLFTFCWYLSMN